MQSGLIWVALSLTLALNCSPTAPYGRKRPLTWLYTESLVMTHDGRSSLAKKATSMIPVRQLGLLTIIATLLLQGCAGHAEPVVESHAGGLTTKQKTEMARQFVSMLPDSLRSGVAVRIDSCFFSLYLGQNPYGGSCTYYVSSVIDGCSLGARVHSKCNSDNVCVFRMEPYEKSTECE